MKKIENNVLTRRNETDEMINNTIPDVIDFRNTSSEAKSNGSSQDKSKDGLLLDISDKLPQFCSRYDYCDAPLCPLDPLIDKRYKDKDDDRCLMAKATRHKYWIGMPSEFQQYLPYQGYFKSEYNRIQEGKRRWNSLSQEEKDRIIARGKDALKKRLER
ncbi:MAG: hypothetical protein QXU18_04895 [Thermoplasmatales archaeon]